MADLSRYDHLQHYGHSIKNDLQFVRLREPLSTSISTDTGRLSISIVMQARYLNEHISQAHQAQPSLGKIACYRGNAHTLVSRHYHNVKRSSWGIARHAPRRQPGPGARIGSPWRSREGFRCVSDRICVALPTCSAEACRKMTAQHVPIERHEATGQ